jgi:hypothetical protein
MTLSAESAGKNCIFLSSMERSSVWSRRSRTFHTPSLFPYGLGLKHVVVIDVMVVNTAGSKTLVLLPGHTPCTLERAYLQRRNRLSSVHERLFTLKQMGECQNKAQCEGKKSSYVAKSLGTKPS